MFESIEYIGVIAFAVSGFLVALRNKLDLLGALVSIFLTALGGGVMRDIILNKTPYSFSHSAPSAIIVAVMLVMILFRLYHYRGLENNPFFILSDSLGLVSFSISGALLATEYGLNFTGTLALGFITAVGGGIARDIIINEVPIVFKSGFYGTVALLVAALIYLLHSFGFVNLFTLIAVLIFGTTLRAVAYYCKWSVPKL